ncbi:hypothetical protein SDJN02_03387, partial [Cucurbita argyrosperma subsp. argyrosperma]
MGHIEKTIIVMHGLVDSDPCGWTPHESCVVTIDLPACDCLPSDQQMTRQCLYAVIERRSHSSRA